MKINFLIIFSCLSILLHAQNVGIGTTTPDNSAALDIQSGDKGMLVPRIALSLANLAAPVTNPANGLVIFNTATAGTGANAVTPGFYYWSSGISRWCRFITSEYGAWGDGVSNNNVGGYTPVAAPNEASNSSFGNSVSISGNWAIVGAPYVGAGSAYLYFFNGITWVQQQKLTPSSGTSDDHFGISVSISGNYAVIGASALSTLGVRKPGMAYIYFFDGSNWVEVSKLTASDGRSGDGFGQDVAVDGNIVMIGAPYANIGQNSSQGAVYVYASDGPGLKWIERQKLTAGTNGRANDHFGTSIGMSGNSAIIGSPANDAGSAYIFSYNATALIWNLKQKLTATDGATGDYFGGDVGISGDHAIVGAPDADIDGKQNQGAVYVYFYVTSWLQDTKLIASDGLSGDYFGYSVSISGDKVIVGAIFDAIVANEDQGSAYLFKRGRGWIPVQKVSDADGIANDNFGVAVAQDHNRFLIAKLGGTNPRKGMAYFGTFK